MPSESFAARHSLASQQAGSETTPVVALGCAHPAKFPDTVEEAAGMAPETPSALADVLAARENLQTIDNDLSALARLSGARGMTQTAKTKGAKSAKPPEPRPEPRQEPRQERSKNGKAPKQSRSATDIREEPQVVRLASGLTVASETMAEADSVTLGLWVRAGAGHEQEDESGLAHLLEHMVFKGTRHRDGRQIVETIEDLGGWINAATGREATSYECKVPPEGVETAIALLAELFHEPLLQDKDLEAEREVVLQELGQAEDTPDDIIFDRFQEQAWGGHSLGRPILGTKKSLRSFTTDSLHGFRARLYEPSRLLLTAAGAIDGDSLTKLAEAAFPAQASATQAKTNQASTTQAKTPKASSTQTSSTQTNSKGAPTAHNGKAKDSDLHFGCETYLNELTTPEYSGGFLSAGKALPSCISFKGFLPMGRRADEWPTLAALSQILGGGMSSRLFQSFARRSRTCLRSP